MANHRAHRNGFLRAGVATLVAGMTLAVTGTAIAPAGADAPDAAQLDHKITICHANEGANGYSETSPAKWQITTPNGHGNDVRDIIPPFDAGQHGGHSWPAFAGLNWDAAGEALHTNRCAQAGAAPVTGDVTLAKVVVGDAVPDSARNAPFSFEVECESGDVPDLTPSIVAGATEALIATAVKVGDTCTITEASVPDGAVVSFDQGVTSGDSTVVTVASDTGVEVVATNTYTAADDGNDDGDDNGNDHVVAAQLAANKACHKTGVLVTVTNAGDAAGSVDVTNKGQVIKQGLAVPPASSVDVLVPVTEDTDYAIAVVESGAAEVTRFEGTKDCEAVAGIVVPAKPAAPVSTPVAKPAPVATPAGPSQSGSPTVEIDTVSVRPTTAAPAGTQVMGITVTRELPRTGTNTLPLAELGFGLALVGAAAVIASRRLDTSA